MDGITVYDIFDNRSNMQDAVANRDRKKLVEERGRPARYLAGCPDTEEPSQVPQPIKYDTIDNATSHKNISIRWRLLEILT